MAFHLVVISRTLERDDSTSEESRPRSPALIMLRGAFILSAASDMLTNCDSKRRDTSLTGFRSQCLTNTRRPRE